MKVRPTAGPPPAALRLSKVQRARSKPAGDFAVLPEVQRLVTKYKPNRDDSIGRPAERVLNRVLTVDRFLTDHADARSLASAMLKDDLRTPLFQLEGPLRLYTPRFGRGFEKALERVKALEDRLGEVLLRRELAALAAEKKFPSAVIGGLRKDERKAMTELEKLVARDWTPNPRRRDQVPALDSVIGRVLDADFGSDEKDVKFLRLAMAEMIEEIEGTKWHLNDLQAGIHELRRRIRWLPIYFQALGGAVQLSEKQNPIAALKELLDTPAAHSPFIQMAGPEREKNPIVLSKSLLIANSGMIDRLGKIKDAGEHVDYLAHALRDAGLAGKKDTEDMARQYLGAGHEEDDVFSAARRDWQAFRAQGVLKELRRELV